MEEKEQIIEEDKTLAMSELIKIAFEEIRRIRIDQKTIESKVDSAITNMIGLASQQF